ncbi:hypothetical protein ACS0TY_011549 [Phlomoides rotata]
MLISKVVDIGELESVKIGRDNLSHLQFVDDTIFICSAKKENAMMMKLILRIFELISRLKVNFHKCSIPASN